AMQQLQKPFKSFLPDMGQIPHGSNVMPIRPAFQPGGVHCLVTRVSNLDASQEGDGRLECPHCGKLYSKLSLQQHIEDIHTVHLSTYECNVCHGHYKTQNSLKVHYSRSHRKKRIVIPSGSIF
ncbi:unnamed protein product, partial [Meganyctiphanes norvegica]